MIRCDTPLDAGQLRGNWEALWRNLPRDHYHAGLIWNEATRAELREALQVRLQLRKFSKPMIQYQARSR